MSDTPELDKLRATLGELQQERADQRAASRRRWRRVAQPVVATAGVLTAAAGAPVLGAAIVLGSGRLDDVEGEPRGD